MLSTFFAMVSTTLVYFWLLFFQDFSVWTLSGVVFGHILYFIFLGPILSAALKYPPGLRPFLIAGVWTVYEFLKSTGYLALPWGLLAHTSGSFLPLIQIADITGQWGISFLIALANAALFELILSSVSLKYFFRLKTYAERSFLFTIILFTAALLYGYVSISRDIPADRFLDAVLVQQNADSWITGNEMESIRKGQILTREALAETNRKPDIVIWSENAFRYPYTEEGIRYRRNPKGDPFKQFLREINTPILIGSPYILDPKTYSALNAVLLVDPDGKIRQYYGKTHPVPFAENIPFWNVPIVRSFFKNVLGIASEGWSVGEPNKIFSLKNKSGNEVTFGAPICFEDSFPSIARGFFLNGADILINLSNDSWSKTISGETQHYIAAKFRAVENRRTLVRSTNAGVTAVIDPYGIPRNMMPLFVSKAELVKIPVYSPGGFTFYTLFGDWFPAVLLMMLVIFRILSIFPVRNGFVQNPA